MKKHFDLESRPGDLLKVDRRDDGVVSLDLTSRKDGRVLTTWQHKPDGTCVRTTDFRAFFDDEPLQADVLKAFGAFGKDNKRMQAAASALQDDFSKFGLVSGSDGAASSKGGRLSSDYVGPMFS